MLKTKPLSYYTWIEWVIISAISIVIALRRHVVGIKSRYDVRTRDILSRLDYIAQCIPGGGNTEHR